MRENKGFTIGIRASYIIWRIQYKMKIQNLLFKKQGIFFSSLISSYICCDVFISHLILYSFGQEKHLWVSADPLEAPGASPVTWCLGHMYPTSILPALVPSSLPGPEDSSNHYAGAREWTAKNSSQKGRFTCYSRT